MTHKAWAEPKEESMRGKKLYDDASKIINGERQDQYGNPEDSFEGIALLWGWYLGHKITPEQVAFMLVIFKTCREKHQHKRDNIVDMAGYLGIYDDLKNKTRGEER